MVYSCDAITSRRIKQVDLTGINRKSSVFTQTVADIRRYPTERALIAEAQYNNCLRSSGLDHFHPGSNGKDGIRRVAESSCRLGDAFGSNAEHNLAANPAFGPRRCRETDRCLTLTEHGRSPTGGRLQAGGKGVHRRRTHEPGDEKIGGSVVDCLRISELLHHGPAA